VVEEKTMSPKELEEFMKRVPQDDVWLREHYPTPCYRLADALRMHRELAAPEMQGNMTGLVYTELELDMSKKKKVGVCVLLIQHKAFSALTLLVG